jgi:hypothetical protein
LNEKILYYKGIHKVKVVTESEGYWIVETMEEFDDFVDDQKVTVKKGETRIVPPESLHKQMTLPPPMQEHVYERKMEQKLKQIVAQEEAKSESEKKP